MSSKISKCVKICRGIDDDMLKLGGFSIDSVLLSDKARRYYYLSFSRVFLHSIVLLEKFLYKVEKGNNIDALLEMFHWLLSLSLVSGYDVDDIGFKEMFIVNASVLINNDMRTAGILTYLLHGLVDSECFVGWEFWWDFDKSPVKVDWQGVRGKLREIFSSFSALCLKLGHDFDGVCDKYIENGSKA